MKNAITRTFSLLFYLVILIGVGCSKSSDDTPNPGPGPIPNPNPGTNNILMFISKEDTYYSEYKITFEALKTAGYNVDVRSSGEGTTNVYTFSGNIDAEQNQVAGATYNDFTSQFQSSFGGSWNGSWNATPATVPLDGRIQEVENMSSYDALIVPGGRGAVAYRYDDAYEAQGNISAEDVRAAAEKLNDLAIEALLAGKPVMALCHGASIPAFFKVPGTSNSILEGQNATGFPLEEEGVEENTATTLANLGVNYRAEDRVTISSPSTAFNDNGLADYKIITTRDWYPQSVAYATRALLNILESYPSKAQIESNTSVLILHGGAVDPNNCSAGNKANDVPCNYGGGDNLPADYTHLTTLLNTNSPNDNFNINVSEVNLFNTTPTYDDLMQYDVVIFFKHWSSGVTQALQNALIAYADDGGGILTLHHGVYNEPENGLNKNIVINQLFGVESATTGFSAELIDYNLFSSNYGHFISTYGIDLNAENPALPTPDPWFSNAPSTSGNLSFSYYQNFRIYDEPYSNMRFVDGQIFGRGINQITPLFSNNIPEAQFPTEQLHTSGFVKLFNLSGDDSVGRVAFFQPGERPGSLNVNHRYGQVIRNAVVWAAQGN